MVQIFGMLPHGVLHTAWKTLTSPSAATQQHPWRDLPGAILYLACLIHEHLLGLPVDLLLKHVGLVTLCTSCPPTLLPAPILLHEVHQATNGPSTGCKLHCIGCDVCNSYTSMFAMVTKEDQGVNLVVLIEGFTHLFEHIPQVVLVICHECW